MNGVTAAFVAPGGDLRTLGGLYLRAEGAPSTARRPAPRQILRTNGPSGWTDVPAWKFFRHVVRAGLFLREHLGLKAGGRVLLMAGLSPQRLVCEWAAAAQGAVVATLGPAAGDAPLRNTLSGFGPHVVVVHDASARDRVRRWASSPPHFVVLDSDASPRSGEASWTQLLDLGGTLDTAERAQAFRAAARALRPDMPAIEYAADVSPTVSSWKTMTHGEASDRVLALWKDAPPRPGELAYAIDGGLVSDHHLALWGAVADGETTIALGTPGREVAELGAVRPSVVLGPREAVERAARAADNPAPDPAGARRWLARGLGGLAARARSAASVQPPRRLMTLEGKLIEI